MNIDLMKTTNDTNNLIKNTSLKDLIQHIEKIKEKDDVRLPKYRNSFMRLKSKYAKNIAGNYFLRNNKKLFKPTMKHTTFIMEHEGTKVHVVVKTKPAMLKHNATGFETHISNFFDKQKENILLIFVDERLGEMYAAFYKTLLKPSTHTGDYWSYPHKQKFGGGASGIFFNLDSFKTLKRLSNEERAYLSLVSAPHVALYPKANRDGKQIYPPSMIFDNKVKSFIIEYKGKSSVFNDEDTAYQYFREIQKQHLASTENVKVLF